MQERNEIFMAVKTNYDKGKYKYFRVTATIGTTPEGKPIKKEFYGKNQKEAIAKKNTYLAELNKGLTIDYDKMSLGELMKIWLFDYVKVHTAPNTLARYMLVYKNYVKSTELNSKKLCDIKFLYLQQYYNKLHNEGISESKIFNLNKVLRNFFNFCITNSYMLVNPTFRIVIPKDDTTENKKEVVDIFTDEEIAAISKNSKNYMYYLFKLAMATGLRMGELLGLELNCIDLDNAEITVKQALKTVNIFDDENTSKREIQLGSTKNNKTRTVPIPQGLISDLKKHINNQKELFLSCGLVYSDTDFLFTTKGCQPINSRNLQRAWERTLKRANVRYRKFHNVRHTYASKLLANGVDIKTISTLLGHSNISITADTYIHVVSETKADAASKINYLFAE